MVLLGALYHNRVLSVSVPLLFIAFLWLPHSDAFESMDTMGPMQERTRRSVKIICLNGTVVSGTCVCRQGYVGTHCERRMNCRSYERKATAEGAQCTHGCKEHWKGDYCDKPRCEHGEEDEFEQRCVCEKPYTGEFCDELLTKNIYLFYNTKVATLGPLGALILIPMILVFQGCEHYARKRQVRRIGKAWGEQVNVDSDRIKYLLKEKT